MRAHDLTGHCFSRLTVLKRMPSKNSKTRWLCRCICGVETEAITDHLISGHTESCGCLRRERLESANTKHGKRHTRLYNVWVHMRQRCGNPKNKDFKYYGGRGITVCDEWRKDFSVFREWALANGYTDELTIDRIDPDGNYCPENCRWVSQAEQNRNRRFCKKEVMP